MKIKVRKVNRKALERKVVCIESEKAVKHLDELKKAIKNAKLEAVPYLEPHVTVITKQDKETTLGECLKCIRKANKLTQIQFAQMVGISQTHVSKIEKNIEHPSETLLILISILFGVRITWIKEGTRQPKGFNISSK